MYVKMNNSNNWDFFVGLGLALSSNLFIGASFIIKKKALLTLQKYGVRAGAGGHGYLRQWIWWAGLITMGIGEGANFVAYAFAPATVVTPLGALSIVITAILSSKYLNEKLNILGKVGCILCILGSTVIVLHAPKSEEVENLDDLIVKLQNIGFISYVCILIALDIYIIFYHGPVHGHENVIVYIFLCSTIGSLTVISCKGLGIALKDTIYGETNQMYNSLTWVFLLSLILCIMIQMNYLNKALDLFDTGIVTPVYYVFFTSFVIIASSILFQEWRQMRLENIIGCICGFFIVIIAIFLLNAFKDIRMSLNDLNQISVSNGEVIRLRKFEHSNISDGENASPNNLIIA